MKLFAFAFIIGIFLASCASSPTPVSITALPSTTPSSQPTRTPTLQPTIVPTPTTNLQPPVGLTGVEQFLPGGSEPLYHLVWYGNAPDPYSRAIYIPYRVQDGISVLVLGQLRNEGNTPIYAQIADWQDAGLEPALWQDIRPLANEQSSFLGRDHDGHWWAVISEVNWGVPELVLLGRFRVPRLDEIPAETLAARPARDLEDLQIEKVALSPEEQSANGLAHYLLREKDRLTLYQLAGGQAQDVWSTDRTMPGRFHVHSYAGYTGSIDMTGDGRREIFIVWELNFPPMIDVYQVANAATERLRWLGRFDNTWQYLDVTGDGVGEFLQPDPLEDPATWQVMQWNGEEFVHGEQVMKPQAILPSATVIHDLADLPPLSSDLVFVKGGNYNQWWRWPADGGLPQEMSKPPSHLYDECAPYMYGGYGAACYSPAGRYKLINMPSHIEGSSTGILDGITNQSVAIPDSFVYSEGYNTFAWSPDEQFLLFARADGFARLTKVNPVTGESKTVLSPSMCGLDVWECQVFGIEGITDPVVFSDGSFGFAFQSPSRALYPPPGIYRLSAESGLTMLIALPYIDETKGMGPDMSPSAPIYGTLLWSPDKSMFLFYDVFVGNKTGIRTLLLGRTDGTALWDLREALPDVNEFRWEW